jgi:hypothetical protein
VTYNLAEFYIKVLAVVPNDRDNSKKSIEQFCDHFGQSESWFSLNKEISAVSGRRSSLNINEQKLLVFFEEI